MATSVDTYQYVVLTDAERRTIVQGELRTVEDQLYRASLSPAYGDSAPLLERAEGLKAKLEALKA